VKNLSPALYYPFAATPFIIITPSEGKASSGGSQNIQKVLGTSATRKYAGELAPAEVGLFTATSRACQEVWPNLCYPWRIKAQTLGQEALNERCGI
jgi:hypothetical protein